MAPENTSTTLVSSASDTSAAADDSPEPALSPMGPRPRPRQYRKVEVVVPRWPPPSKFLTPGLNESPSVGPVRTRTRKATKDKKERKKRFAAVTLETGYTLDLTEEQRIWLKTVHLKEYMAVRHSGAALARYRPSLWSDFVALWPEVDKPPFPEEPDMVEFYHAREAKELTSHLEFMFLWGPARGDTRK